MKLTVSRAFMDQLESEMPVSVARLKQIAAAHNVPQETVDALVGNAIDPAPLMQKFQQCKSLYEIGALLDSLPFPDGRASFQRCLARLAMNVEAEPTLH